MTTQEPFQITAGGKEYIEKTVQVLTPVFECDPVYTWLLQNFPLSKHQSFLLKLLRAFFTQGALNHGLFVEVGDFGCCGLFMPPGSKVENPWTLFKAGLIPALYNLGFGPFKRAMFEYATATESMMKDVFTKEEQRNKRYWYVFIMGTAVNRRRQGLANALLVHMQDRCRGEADGRPIWLEATTELSRELYLKHGFRIVGEIVLGKGKVGSDGLPQNQGEGLKIWSMLWRP